MNKSDARKFAEMMILMGEVFECDQPSEQKVEIYFSVLHDMSISDFEVAVNTLINQRTVRGSFPVPAEIRQALSGGNTSATIALDKAEKAAEQYGSYRSVQFDDPVIHMVIESMGGWPKFCRPDDDQDWHWHQKEFMRLYEAFAKSGRSCMKYLPGIHERENSANGMPWGKQLVILGEGLKSKKWLRISEKEQGQLSGINFLPNKLV